MLEQFHSQCVGPIYPANNYMYDAYIDSQGRVSVIDFEPISKYADIGLFTAEVSKSVPLCNFHQASYLVQLIHGLLWSINHS